MTDALKSWWQGRTRREQHLLTVMLALLLIVMLWLALIRPITAMRADAENRHARAVQSLAEIHALVDDIRRASARPVTPIDAPLGVFISRHAAEVGLTLARLDMVDGDKVMLTIDAVRATALLGWIDRIENRHGLRIERLLISRNEDATVSAQLTIQGRGR